MKYLTIHGQTHLLGWASQINEYCWASAVGTKVRNMKAVRMRFLTLRNLIEEADIKAVKCDTG